MKRNQRNKTVLTRLKTFAIIISASLPAFAHSQSLDADTMVDSFNSAFYVYNGGNAYIKANTGGGTADFWKFAEMIEMEVDAYTRTGNATYLNNASSLVNGFVSIHGSSWSNNSFNDDIMWMCIACLRVYQANGNTTFRTYAKNNFDMVYARAYDTTLGGGLWWNTSKGSKNACVNGPGAIAASLLYESLGDSGYLTKAQNIYNWEHSHLFNASTGAVYDSELANGSVDQSSYSYNLGTFIGATDYLGTLGDGELAANYEMNVIAGGGLLPNYGQNGDGGGFNGIFARWMMKFVHDNNLYSTYAPWLHFNADAALSVRRSDNLSWNNWAAQTPAGTLAAFDCSSSVVLTQVAPPPTPLLAKGYGGGDTIPDAVLFDSIDQTWTVRFSNDGSLHTFSFGQGGTPFMSLDFDGDGLSDAVLFNAGNWTVRFSTGGSLHTFLFGQAGDKPLVVPPFVGDPQPDAVLFRPSNGNWYVRFSRDASIHNFAFGQNGDIPMMSGDFDGDGNPDAVKFTPSTGTWQVRFSTDASIHTFLFGLNGDMPLLVPPFVGDPQPDAVLFRPSNGTWYVRFSRDASIHTFAFGESGDIPMMSGDFDGDGNPDAVLYRPSNDTWYVRYSSDASIHSFSF